MSNGFTSMTTLAAVTPPDPTKHVNYSLGMILGVDDLTQEFAYLTGHDQWLARDALGYGTLNGLRVTGSVAPNEPQVVVSAGTALTPSGKLVRVCANQCAQLVTWAADHQTEIVAHVGSSPPPVGDPVTLPLYVVLRYGECQTDWVPVPGDPCRTEDDLQAASRIADNFTLELRFSAPQQMEVDAIGHFAHWLANHIHVVTTPGVQLSAVIEALRTAATPGPDDPYINDSSPAGPLSVNVQDVPALMRAVHRLWVTELRPRWRPAWLGSGDSCSQAYVPVQPDDGDCVLLARINLTLVQQLQGGDWVIRWLPSPGPGVPADHVVIVEDEQPTSTDIPLRPILTSTRLLQELYPRLSGGVGLAPPAAAGPLGVRAAPPSGASTTSDEAPTTLKGAADVAACSVIAAGVVEVVSAATDAARSASNSFNLRCVTAKADGVVAVTFATTTNGPWVVQVTQVTDGSGRSYAVSYDEAESANTKNGFALRVRNGLGASARDVSHTSLVGVKLMIQVLRYST